MAIGCGCADCMQLDTFLRSTDDFTCYKTSQPRRTHVESQMRKEKAVLDKFVTTDREKYGSLHSLYVRKRLDAMTELKWDDRKADALAFVNCVYADDKILRQLMGAKHDDVLNAINGTKAFVAASAASGNLTSDGETTRESVLSGGPTMQVGKKRSSNGASAHTTAMERQRVR